MDKELARKIWGGEWIVDLDIISDAIHHINLNKSAKILDVGTGLGIMAVNLASEGFDVITGEPEVEEQLYENHEHEHYERNLEEHIGYRFTDWTEAVKIANVENKVHFQHFNAERLEFSTESFDGVFLYDSLQHIDNREKALKECIRVTKPNGIICVIETNKYGQKYFKEVEGFEIDLVDPRNFVISKNMSIEVLRGHYSDAYILKKQ